MSKRIWTIVPLFGLLSSIAAAQPTAAVEPCDSRVTSYAAAAFTEYKNAISAGYIPGQRVEGRQIVDAVFGSRDYQCRLPGTGFEQLVDVEVVMLDQNDIMALRPDGYSPRHFKFYGFQELDPATSDVVPGTYKIEIGDFDGWRRITTDEDPEYSGSACAWTLWVVDADHDGVVEYVRFPPHRNGMCT